MPKENETPPIENPSKFPVVKPGEIPASPVPTLDALCDVPGCGRAAFMKSTGSEVDEHHEKLGETLRPAVPKLFVCHHHRNWIHSKDARVFAGLEAITKKENPPYNAR